MAKPGALRGSLVQAYLVASPLVAFLAAEVEYVKPYGTAAMLGWTGLGLLGVGAQLLGRLWEALAWRGRHGLRIPRPGTGGMYPGVEQSLARLAGALRLRASTRFRVTVFVLHAKGDLVQVARYEHDGSTIVSRTRIRVGTCAVGHAFNRGETWYLPDVNLGGGFEKVLRWCGLSPEEIAEQNLKTQRCFWATPLFASHPQRGEEVVAVLAIDTETPAAIPDNVGEHIGEVETLISGALFPAFKTAEPSKNPPRAAERNESVRRLPSDPERLLPGLPGAPTSQGDEEVMQAQSRQREE